MRFRSVYLSRAALLTAVLALILAIATAAETLAHHPGSHATRDGAHVRLDLAVTVPDSCTAVVAIERGAPPAVAAPPGAEPVTVRLERPSGLVCTAAVAAVRRDAVLPVPPETRFLHLFIVGPEGVRSTERVPIR